MADGLLLLAVAIVGAIVHQPGVFSVDESHYLLASQAVAERGTFQIQNGYERFADPSLLFFYTVVPDRLNDLGTVASVPPFHALLSVPFLGLAGHRGLIFLNLLAFGLCLVAVRRTAARLCEGSRLPLVATAVFGLCTFSLEYAFGIWPHALSQALMAWTVLLVLEAKSTGRAGVWMALLAGLLGGMATGVRLQNILLLPVLGLAALVWLRLSWTRLAALAAGWLPPIAGMALINQQRLGTLNPFTYGASSSFRGPLGQVFSLVVAHPWLLAAAALAVAACAWLWLKTRRKAIWAGLAAAALAVALIVPAFRALLFHWSTSAGFHLVAPALAPDGGGSAGASLNDLGQVLYGGVMKKSLLQAAPFALSVLLFVFVRRPQSGTTRRLGFLSAFGLGGAILLPLVLSAGGWCYNPRYLLELLPALAVVTVFWGARLTPRRTDLLAGALAGVLASLPLILNPGRVDSPSGGWLPMLIPLALACLLLICTGLALAGPTGWRALTSRAAAALLAAGVLYGGVVHLRVDLTTSLTVRYYAAQILAEGRQAVPDRSVLLAWETRKDVFSPLKLDRDVWIVGLGRRDRQLPGFIPEALEERRVVVLRNGIPAERWAAWISPFRTRVQERRGLVFVELLRGETP